MKFFKSMTLGATMALTVLPLLATQANAETLTITIDSTLETLDPHNSTANAVASISNGVMQRLIGFDKDMKMVPMLAESWTVNDNATVFTFKLRQGVTFHDGTAFDAAAAKVNIDRLADQSNNLKRNSMMRVVAKTEVVDENTFRLTLKEPFGAMLATLAHPSIVMHSPKSLAEDGGDVSKHPVGTGPFVFNEWVPGERYSVVANPNYWEAGLPKVDGVNFLTVKETATSIAMLKADEAQFVFPLPPELFETVEADANFNILEVPGENTRLRDEGVQEVVARYPDVQIIQTVGDLATIEGSVEKVQNAIAANLGNTDGMIATGYTPTVAVAELLTEYHEQGGEKIHFFGIDTDAVVMDAIRDGHIDGTLAQNPYGHGYIPLEILRLMSEGYTPVEGTHAIDAGVLTVTADNIDTYEGEISTLTQGIIDSLVGTYLTK